MPDQRSVFSPPDQSAFVGPFSAFLTPPQQTNAERSLQGTQTTGSGIANAASAFLEGATRGRIKAYEQKENQKLQRISMLTSYVNQINNNPDLTPEAKNMATQRYYQALGHGVLDAAGKGTPKPDDPHGGIIHTLKSLALGVTGGQTPKGAPDVGAAMADIHNEIFGQSGAANPQYHVPTQINTVMEAAKAARASQAPNAQFTQEVDPILASYDAKLIQLAGPNAPHYQAMLRAGLQARPEAGSAGWFATMPEFLGTPSAQAPGQAAPASGVPAPSPAGMTDLPPAPGAVSGAAPPPDLVSGMPRQQLTIQPEAAPGTPLQYRAGEAPQYPPPQQQPPAPAGQPPIAAPAAGGAATAAAGPPQPIGQPPTPGQAPAAQPAAEKLSPLMLYIASRAPGAMGALQHVGYVDPKTKQPVRINARMVTIPGRNVQGYYDADGNRLPVPASQVYPVSLTQAQPRAEQFWYPNPPMAAPKNMVINGQSIKAGEPVAYRISNERNPDGTPKIEFLGKPTYAPRPPAAPRTDSAAVQALQHKLGVESAIQKIIQDGEERGTWKDPTGKPLTGPAFWQSIAEHARKYYAKDPAVKNYIGAIASYTNDQARTSNLRRNPGDVIREALGMTQTNLTQAQHEDFKDHVDQQVSAIGEDIRNEMKDIWVTPGPPNPEPAAPSPGMIDIPEQ